MPDKHVSYSFMKTIFDISFGRMKLYSRPTFLGVYKVIVNILVNNLFKVQL